MKAPLLFFSILILVSCHTEELSEFEMTHNVVCDASADSPMYTKPVVEKFIVVGPQLQNPFTVDNMQKALSRLRDGGDDPARGVRQMQAADVRTTHYYVKISPKNLEQLSLLRADSTLALYPYPLDHEISGEGSLPGEPAGFDPQTFEVTLKAPLHPLYAAIPVDKSLPAGIDYVLLDELCLPDEADGEGWSLAAESEGLPTDQALYATGGRSSRELIVGGRDPWTPSGTIRVFDTELNRYVGVQKAKVRIRIGFLTDIVYTDKNGYFKGPRSCIGAVDYSIDWATNEYAIVTPEMNLATYASPGKVSALNLDIPRQNATFGYATLMRALYSHFDGPTNVFERTSGKQIVVAYRHEYSDVYAGYFDSNFYDNSGKITIAVYGLKSSLELRTSAELLSTTFHELGHCAMYCRLKQSNIKISKYDKVIYESWGAFIGWYMLDAEYKSLGHNVYSYKNYIYISSPGNPITTKFYEIPNDYNKQWVYKAIYEVNEQAHNYTPVFIDLIDDSNQKLYYESFFPVDEVFPDDKLCTKSYSALNSILYQSYSLAELKANLAYNANALGLSVADLNTYFAFYNL